jgi:transcriptional regulator with XRE-family HTH domain
MPITSPKHGNDPVLVAHRSAVDRSYMSSIERGGQNPGIMSVVRIAHAMDVTMTELMAEAEL